MNRPSRSDKGADMTRDRRVRMLTTTKGQTMNVNPPRLIINWTGLPCLLPARTAWAQIAGKLRNLRSHGAQLRVNPNRVSRVRVILLAHDGTLAAMRRHLFAENFVHPGNRLLHPCCEAHQTVCCGTPLLSGIRRRLSLCHVHESSAARIGRCLHLPDGQRVGARATASQSASRENQGKQTP